MSQEQRLQKHHRMEQEREYPRRQGDQVDSFLFNFAWRTRQIARVDIVTPAISIDERGDVPVQRRLLSRRPE